MKYIKTYESHRESRINEELFGSIINFFKGLWNKATEELKKLGKTPSVDKIEDWIDKNPMNPTDDTYIFKGIIDDFNKTPAATNDQIDYTETCLTLISNILHPETGALGKQGLKPLYDGLIKAFGNDSPTIDVIQFYLESMRNRAIKDYKFAGGPDLVVGKSVIDDKKIIIDLKDTTHLPDYKKVLATAGEDDKKKKQLAIDWVNKTLVPRLDKYLAEMNNDVNFDKKLEEFIKSKGKELPPEGEPEGGYKIGDTVVYKREKFDQVKWDALTDDDKKKPNEGKMKELQVDGIGIKKISKIEGDTISFEGADFTKTMTDLLMKSEVQVEGQEDLVNTLKDLKTKNPEAIKKIDGISKLYSDPVANKDKIAEIDKLIGGGAEA